MSKLAIHKDSWKQIDALPEEARRFIEDLISECILNGVTLKMVHRVTFDGSLGWFSAEDKRLVVCTKNPIDEWLSTAIHESCHMDQWIAESKHHKNFIKEPHDLQDWLDGKINPSKREVSRMINIIQKHELDCEKRSVKKIVDYNLTHVINTSLYIKKANDILFTYALLKETRRWPDWKKVKGKYRKLFTEQPDHFLKSYKYVPTWFRDMATEILS